MNLQLCKNCKNVSICKIYDLLNSNMHIVEVTMQHCKQFNSNEVDNTNNITDSLNAPLLSPRPARQYQNFKELSKQVKEEGKKRSPVVSILKEETVETEALTICKSCGGTTYVSDIIPCTKCGDETCSNCRTVVVETNQKLCDKCWSEE